MKMTMHIDADMLDRVRKWTGAASKTEAVRLALEEIDRKGRLAEYGRNGLGLTRTELARAWDTSYDVSSLRVAESPAAPTTQGGTAGPTPVYPRKRQKRE